MSDFKSVLAATIRQEYQDFNYNTARKLVAQNAHSGLITVDRADKHNNGVARLLVEGEEVGQYSRFVAGLDFSERRAIEGW